MKIGFSSLVCPVWDLESILNRASELGFDGVELRGLGGELHLPLVPELAADPDALRRRFEQRNLELVCLGASSTMDSRNRRAAAVQKGVLVEFIELAARLGCPFVRIYVGEVQRRDHRRKALARIAGALESLVSVLSRNRVTLLVENGGDFPDSEAMWFLSDAVGHPAVRICWNQCHAMTVLERATSSIPRLGGKIGLVHICDASFDEQGVLLDYKPLGEGDVEVAGQINLLRGLLYDGYLVFDWPKWWVESLPGPDVILPQAAACLRDRLAAKQKVLSAYKGDKHAPKMASRSPAPSAGAAATT